MIDTTSNTANTEPKVFIIESLDLEDEQNNHYEGKVISDILNFAGLEHQYHYIRTRTELEYFLEQFAASRFRYLHISYHGNKNSIATTLDDIPFADLSVLLGPVIDKKRLFMSACSTVNANLASKIIAATECYSIIGPCEDVNMDDAAIFWASFYHLMFKQNKKSMKKDMIKETIKKLAALHKVQMKNYSSSDNAAKGWKEIILK